MVNQNYILYVNQNRSLRTASVKVENIGEAFKVKFSIPEKHLICGLILQGIPIKGDRLKNFPFKPIEKYLFEFSNIHFTIPDLEFTVENTDYSYSFSSTSLINTNEIIVPFKSPLFSLFLTREGIAKLTPLQIGMQGRIFQITVYSYVGDVVATRQIEYGSQDYEQKNPDFDPWFYNLEVLFTSGYVKVFDFVTNEEVAMYELQQ